MENHVKKIFKYPLAVTDEQAVFLPQGTKPLSVQTQHEEPQLWVLVDPEEPVLIRHTVRIFGTGHPVDIDLEQYDFMGTFQMSRGNLVFHVFISK